jgi:hypothetical protein
MHLFAHNRRISKSSKWITAALMLIALAVRSVGLFRGVDEIGSYHPDVAKQMRAVDNYLRGCYIWYVGSLFYDGYPYGLNHVDEWLIRLGWPPARALARFVDPAAQWPERPDMPTLYRICLGLRVLYSMLALSLFLWILARIGVPVFLRHLWGFIAATAPLSSTVTHAATGDVGTDLFVIASLACLARARMGDMQARNFLGAGIALGLAFACKYHGVLGAIMPGLFLSLAPMTWRMRFRLGLWFTAGLLIGFVILTPHVLWTTKTTLTNIWLNFHFIKNYNVPKEFLQIPFIVRAREGLIANTPVVIFAIGSGVLSLAGLAVFLSILRLVRSRSSETAWDFALIAMPFISLFLSLIGKPSLQPFHFSFLVLPLILGAASVWRKMSLATSILFGALTLWTAVDHVKVQRTEWRFWTREEMRVAGERLSADLAIPPAHKRDAHKIAVLAVEGRNLPVFRNRPYIMRVAHGDVWSETAHDCIPAIAWRGSPHWIFADLPAFPRETRLLSVLPGEPVQRYVAQKVTETNLLITLMAGPRESEIDLRVDGRRVRARLLPNETRTFSFDAARGDPIDNPRYAGRLHDLRVRARGAPVLARVGPVPHVDPPPDRLAWKARAAHFLNGANEAREGVAPLSSFVALTPGRYEIDVSAPADAPPMTLRVESLLLKHPDRIIRVPFVWDGDVWRAEWLHGRDYLFAALFVDTATSLEIPFKWHIRPVRAVLESPSIASREWRPLASFGRGRWALGNLEMPSRIARGEHLRVRLQIDSDPRGREKLDGFSAFIHLLDAQGRQVFARDIRLYSISSRYSDEALVHDLGQIDLLPGHYEVRAGIYNLRDKKRVKPDIPHGRDRRIAVGSLQVE